MICLDDAHLLITANKTLHHDKDGQIIVLCQPTTSDVNITLKKDGKVVNLQILNSIDSF